MTVAAALLLWTGVALVLLGCAGVASMLDAYSRLHFTAPAGIGAALIGLAVLVAQGTSLIGDKALLTAAIVIVSAPAVSHATARATALRQGDTFASGNGDDEDT